MATFLQLLEICAYFVLAYCDILLEDTVAAHHQVLSYANLEKLANSKSWALQNFAAVKNSIAEISAPLSPFYLTGVLEKQSCSRVWRSYLF